ncbi:M23 family metallopeptidase [Marinibactrum halimedae]|uniref:Periplasmic metalloprotease M23B family protein n=1 Tax=Marinibactrum halimedae TaxID=1444977 RepID=A0AA37WLU5_9GAMM|nr:M23 family metallopeptidase [Marinibactrum halimedae]MCD9458637.1 M23 family metallopeptidase [Marinibactrum halimedae]GLS25998.1 periplasmic metalloprotease M23B family protein [Marinibactrum halimedae]
MLSQAKILLRITEVRLIATVIALGLSQWAVSSSFNLPELVFDQEVKQGAILRGKVPQGTELEVDDSIVVPVADSGNFVIGLDRDAPSVLKIKVRPLGGQVFTKEFEVKARDYKIQRIEGVPAKTVNPDPHQIARSRKEAALVRKARAGASSRQDFTADFEWPLFGPISGVYGSQRYYNGEPRRPHYGVDIARPTGTPVKAPAAGKVTLVHPDMFYSGGTLIIDHGHGLTSTFLHLSKILVKDGQVVQQGDEIAEVGSSGRATGPHLDWRMNWFDRRVDPTTLVGPMPSEKTSTY